MEYSGDLPKVCPGIVKTSSGSWKLIAAVIFIIAVIAVSYWGYNKYMVKKNEDEALLVDVTRAGARSYPGDRIRLQPLPYRCPYNTY
jgi:hypothetical protein